MPLGGEDDAVVCNQEYIADDLRRGESIVLPGAMVVTHGVEPRTAGGPTWTTRGGHRG